MRSRRGAIAIEFVVLGAACALAAMFALALPALLGPSEAQIRQANAWPPADMIVDTPVAREPDGDASP